MAELTEVELAMVEEARAIFGDVAATELAAKLRMLRERVLRKRRFQSQEAGLKDD